ncbi:MULTISPECIES: GntP family permease [Brevibacillus]|jgi:H+/gluconate symporter-like permease|uniref:Putative transporter YxjC n=1 Tax=Brevibacillus parabrevis TaxID=54914 RepID=A0A4Y3PW48_BREPA|nr:MULTISPECIES: GntP family permease [Brevibacillus]TGV29702.1 GntP family permease [Mesorhizobium sp. M00.F.Ca.ET.186.01.1.1]MBU8716165.1 GntP family permease [Brevibacillus parabrevis]MDH6353377.1 H+/gluconate symporter-like permease [Brevibacillus sp. 1238]MDR5001618.1 GntP family permease [Brevibacillus parabrevis]MED1724661.1 GntP family permease [Brevibacillus parabrevis]
MIIEVLSIVIALGLLMFFAYRGYPVIVFAPIFTLLAVVLSGIALLPSYTETFMTNAANYVKSFFPIFLLGAIFGKVMELSGAASSIAHTIVKALGSNRAILAVVLACSILTYGGVSLFVVAFAVYPFAAAIFREANIPKRLIPGTIALGAFTYTMDALPGTPQIQNIIPTTYFGTDAYAAPVVGIIGAIIVFVGGMAWLERRRKQAAAAGEGYGEGHSNEPELLKTESYMNIWVAILPLALVLVGNYLFSRGIWTVEGWYDATMLKDSFKIEKVKNVVSSWALIISLSLGILAALLINVKQVKNKLASGLTAAAMGALLAIFNTASEVGFGNVVKTLPGFKLIQGWILGASDHPLVSEAVAVNVLAGVTGSASGGMSIALEVMGKQYLEMANAAGISPELLHRIASMASGGMDTLPHNGAVITLLAITGLTHRQSYKDIFAITVLKTAAVFLLAFAVSIF